MAGQDQQLETHGLFGCGSGGNAWAIANYLSETSRTKSLEYCREVARLAEVGGKLKTYG
jgi:hypothetical protein